MMGVGINEELDKPGVSGGGEYCVRCELLQRRVKELEAARKILNTVLLCVLAAEGNGWSLDELMDEQVRDGIKEYFRDSKREGDQPFTIGKFYKTRGEEKAECTGNTGDEIYPCVFKDGYGTFTTTIDGMMYSNDGEHRRDIIGEWEEEKRECPKHLKDERCLKCVDSDTSMGVFPCHTCYDDGIRHNFNLRPEVEEDIRQQLNDAASVFLDEMTEPDATCHHCGYSICQCEEDELDFNLDGSVSGSAAEPEPPLRLCKDCEHGSEKTEWCYKDYVSLNTGEKTARKRDAARESELYCGASARYFTEKER